jgi:hypothetical protein
MSQKRKNEETSDDSSSEDIQEKKPKINWMIEEYKHELQANRHDREVYKAEQVFSVAKKELEATYGELEIYRRVTHQDGLSRLSSFHLNPKEWYKREAYHWTSLIPSVDCFWITQKDKRSTPGFGEALVRGETEEESEKRFREWAPKAIEFLQRELGEHEFDSEYDRVEATKSLEMIETTLECLPGLREFMIENPLV